MPSWRAVFGHRDDLVVDKGNHEVAAELAARGLISAELEHSLVASPWYEMYVSAEAFAFVDVLGVGEGRTRPVGAVSVGFVAPPPEAGADALPLHSIGHQFHERFDVPVIQRGDCRLETRYIVTVHTVDGCGSES